MYCSKRKKQGNLDTEDTGTYHLCNLSVNWNFKVYFFNKEEKEYQVAFKISRRIREPDLKEWCPSQELVPWRYQCTITEYKHSMSATYLMGITFFFFIWPLHAACGILILQTGTKSMPPALEAKNLNHWAAREGPDTVTGASSLCCPHSKTLRLWETRRPRRPLVCDIRR